MEDFELSIINLIYDYNLIVYEKTNDVNIQLVNIYGDKYDTNKSLITLCYKNNNHFVVLYEKDRKKNIRSNLLYNDLEYAKKIIIKLAISLI